MPDKLQAALDLIHAQHKLITALQSERSSEAAVLKEMNDDITAKRIALDALSTPEPKAEPVVSKIKPE